MIGSLITAAWPAKYLSRGTILVTSQEIPTNLVQPTVAALANDRIQTIEQRIMTRDNLLAIAKKFRLSRGWEGAASGTELVDFIKKRTDIRPTELNLKGFQNRNQQKPREAIAFSVGFEYENPQIATKVANELITMILNEDVRHVQNSDAAETTKFLDQEVKRLEGLLSANDSQISVLKQSRISNQTTLSQPDDEKMLTQLKQELVFKSANYSSTHPDIVALKRKITALEKTIAEKDTKGKKTSDLKDTKENASVSATTKVPGLDALETKRDSLRDELNKATQKLSTARLGESMERGQHSERLEVIEQPTPPTKPVSPNRPKILAFVFVCALMAGGGLVFAAEYLNQSVRRSSDLFSLVDSHLVVSIPYIATQSELRRRRRKIILVVGIITVLVIAGLITLFFILPPLDILFAKVMTRLFR